jgi:hypothetical protein
MSSIAVRPEASVLIVARISKLPLEDQKKAYLEKMLRKIKENQSLLIHNMGGGALGNNEH